MKDFKKSTSGSYRGGGGDRGGNRYGKPSFGGDRPRFGGGRGGDRGGRGGFDGPKQMFEATCSNCGKRCEVPFRPTGEKPVYCRDCFAQRENVPSYRNPRQEEPRAAQSQTRDTRIDDIKKQLEAVNAKLDQLLKGSKVPGTAVVAVPELRFTEELKAVEKSKKKAVSKKKKK